MVSACHSSPIEMDPSFNPTQMAYINVLSSDPITFLVPKVSRTGFLCGIASYTVPTLPAAFSFDNTTGSYVTFTLNSGYKTIPATYTIFLRITTDDGLFEDKELTYTIEANCALSPVY